MTNLFKTREPDELFLKVTGFKVSVKNTVSVFSVRSATNFNIPKCKLEHELKYNMSKPNAFSYRPYLLSERAVSILDQFQ